MKTFKNMEEKKYTIDEVPSSAKDIINKAKEYDQEFASSGFYQTSVAAGILRGQGHSVGEVNK